MNSIDGAVERIQARLRHRQLELGYLLVFFAVFAALAHLFPLNGDDWAWGSQIGLDRLDSFFRGLNGRYAGNIAVLLLTRSAVLAPVVIAAVVTLTIYLVLDLTRNRTKLGYSVVTLLFLAMPLGMWRQSVAWVSGFSNYALAALCVLVYLRAAKRDWSQPGQRDLGVGHYAGILVFGFLSQLFMEHVTAYLIVASIAYLVAYRLKFSAFSVSGIYWCVAFLSGAVLMFSNGAYRVAAEGGSQYQKIPTGPEGSRLVRALSKVDVVSASAVIPNTYLNLALVVLMCLTVGLSASRLSIARQALVLSLITAFLVVTGVLRSSFGYVTWLGVAGLSGAASAPLLLALLATATAIMVDRERRAMLLICCGSIVVLVVPLTMVEPIGPRCFYPTYIIFLIAVSVLLKDVQGAADRMAAAFVPFAGALAVALLASDFWVYAIIHQASEDRLSLMRAEVARGATMVTLRRLPFTEYVHVPDPLVAPWVERYKLFYGVPDTLAIHMAPCCSPVPGSISARK